LYDDDDVASPRWVPARAMPSSLALENVKLTSCGPANIASERSKNPIIQINTNAPHRCTGPLRLNSTFRSLPVYLYHFHQTRMQQSLSRCSQPGPDAVGGSLPAVSGSAPLAVRTDASFKGSGDISGRLDFAFIA
jgi:hypothetical protein